MKAVIIEDTFTALEELKALLEDNHPEVHVVGHATSEPEAIDLLRRERPNLVFMDIELLSGGDGFRVVEQARVPEMQVVFVSDHAQLAFRAFRFENVVDFLAKPVDEDELAVAVGRAKAQLGQRHIDEAFRDLKETVLNATRPRIALADQKHIIFPYIHTIVHIKAKQEASHFFFDTKPGQMLVSKNIGEFKKLTQHHPQLMLVHRSHIINVNHVVEYRRFDRTAILSNGDDVPISNEYVRDFLDLLGSNSR